jgi:hypothetical protein
MPALKSGQAKDRHGDAAVALMLAYAATRAPMLAYDYESADTAASNELRPRHDDDGPGMRRGLW